MLEQVLGALVVKAAMVAQRDRSTEPRLYETDGIRVVNPFDHRFTVRNADGSLPGENLSAFPGVKV